jgi:hypothetical protein
MRFLGIDILSLSDSSHRESIATLQHPCSGEPGEFGRRQSKLATVDLHVMLAKPRRGTTTRHGIGAVDEKASAWVAEGADFRML